MKNNATEKIPGIDNSPSCNNESYQRDDKISLSLLSPEWTVLSLCSPPSTVASSQTERQLTSTRKTMPLQNLMTAETATTPIQPQRVRFYAMSSPEIRAMDISPTTISSTTTTPANFSTNSKKCATGDTGRGGNHFSRFMAATPVSSSRSSRNSPYSLQKKLPFTILATSSPEIKKLNLSNATMSSSTPFKHRSSTSCLYDVEEDEEDKMEMIAKKEAVSPFSVEEGIGKLSICTTQTPLHEKENVNKLPSTINVKGKPSSSLTSDKSCSEEVHNKGRKVLSNRTNTLIPNSIHHRNSTTKKGLQKRASSKSQDFYGGNNIDTTLYHPQKYANCSKMNRKSNHYRSSFQSLPSPEEISNPIHYKKSCTSYTSLGAPTPKTQNTRKLRTTNRHLSVSTGFR